MRKDSVKSPESSSEALRAEIETLRQEKNALSNQLQNAYALWRSSKVANASLERSIEKLRSKKTSRSTVAL